MEPVIEVRHLVKTFRTTRVLDDISLKLEKGMNMAILGKSGVGKSVLAKCIVRLIDPDEGEIRVLGQNMLELDAMELDEVRKRIGYIFQGGALYDSMTVQENLEFQVRRTKEEMSQADLDALVEESLRNVGLLEAIHKMPAELSGGMKKRVAVARTLIFKPEIIVYDEPTTGLDPVTAGEISELILNVQEKYNTSSLIITHDMKCVKMTANHLKIIANGRFYTQGSWADLYQSTDPEIRGYFH
ncbi:ABC transporter ATP-binding protein [Mangrovibacterium marinum]|uniref:Phospholipid/cholesterol/gamma-HCH transport system ATP-binding protein n=1 Tax=Mangrovibacterium marinum TaxID=1639118 RepID=A0A2T5C397_9BACT|nr:ATP-binding cassette domain-containing protein [Mangrovibacterium marinum]PTN09250.1 phospholipid/cholesterol/gamma-HCH transport system ATP-binding protein [Mangrovibacterium marinum]